MQHLTKEEKAERIKWLKSLLKPGEPIYTILRHCSRSGMYRVVSLYMIRKNEPYCLDFAAELLFGYDRKHQGCKVRGYGMNMGFKLVYDLGRILYPKGFKTKKGYIRNSPMKFDPDGGYAFHQRWL